MTVVDPWLASCLPIPAIRVAERRFICKEITMGKYVLGWLLGVPAVALVLLYLVFH